MRFVSTRDATRKVPLSEAIRAGIAPDGGLYVPERMPHLEPADFEGARTLPEVAERWIAPFCEGDPLAPRLGEVVRDAFSFPAPLRRIAAEPLPVSVLELFHGPTAAFKDFGARFLAACLERQPHDPSRPVTILVATSGDTGGAVAAAFHGRPWARVVVLYPKGLVSPRQEKQLTCWGGNVRALSVRGTFDDCQRLVKEAFADASLRARFDLSSANSINIGRLLPQAAYYAAASLTRWRADGSAPAFVVPSGNLGNVLACLWARTAGLPISTIELAHNANRTVPDFLVSGEWLPRPSVATLASAMDVGNPSNMERLRHLHPDWRELARTVRAHSVTDEEIRVAIRRDFGEWGETWCPHTATAAHVYRNLPVELRAARHWVLVATAHPAKFESVVEPLIGRPVEIPKALAELLDRPSQATEIGASLDGLRGALLSD
ncbi:MAG: threonine synthase [Steroidobacteraceae bacterium]|jgi:threonine synthase|nr:threonine synthase [Steroidobacteraceae bacterium]